MYFVIQSHINISYNFFHLESVLECYILFGNINFSIATENLQSPSFGLLRFHLQFSWWETIDSACKMPLQVNLPFEIWLKSFVPCSVKDSVLLNVLGNWGERAPPSLLAHSGPGCLTLLISSVHGLLTSVCSAQDTAELPLRHIPRLCVQQTFTEV